jgi:hypothetical protein
MTKIKNLAVEVLKQDKNKKTQHNFYKKGEMGTKNGQKMKFAV